MTTEPQTSVSFFNSVTGAIKEIFLGLILVAVGTLVAWPDTAGSTSQTIGRGVIGVGIVLAGVWKLYIAYRTLKPGGRLAMRISDHGLKLEYDHNYAWNEIERLVVFSGARGASVNRQLISVFSREGDLRILLFLKNKDGESKSPLERSLPAAFERDLVGRTEAFNELVSVLYPYAQRHGVPMTVEAIHRPWVADQMGIPRQEGSVW